MEMLSGFCWFRRFDICICLSVRATDYEQCVGSSSLQGEQYLKISVGVKKQMVINLFRIQIVLD